MVDEQFHERLAQRALKGVQRTADRIGGRGFGAEVEEVGVARPLFGRTVRVSFNYSF